MRTSARVFRFGRNELDTERYELRRMGKRVRLSRALTELLLLLVERQGKLVTREEIAAHLWTNPEMVDVVQGINTAINRLRGVLNDDPSKPRFIETVIGKGYRFVADVQAVEPAESPLPRPAMLAPEPPLPKPLEPRAEASSHPAPSLSRHKLPADKTRRLGRWAILAGALISLLAIGLVQWRKPRSTVVHDWSFRQLTTSDSDNQITASALSPDGKLLAYANAGGINLRALQGGSERLLESPPELQVNRIGWFADDLRLAVSGYVAATLRPQIWVVFLTGEAPHLLADDARNGVPSPDGNHFAYTIKRDREIWVAGANGEDPRRVLTIEGSSFPFVLWSANSERLIYQRAQYAPPLSHIASPREELNSDYRWSCESVVLASGHIVSSVADVKFDSASLLPGGEMIYSRWGTPQDRSSYTLWGVATDPATGAFRSSPRILTTFRDAISSSVSASSDGKEIAVILQRDHPAVYVGDLRRNGPGIDNIRRITFDSKSAYPHAWTPASDAVIYESDKSGRYQVYKQRLESRRAELLTWTPQAAVLPLVAAGGQWVLFAERTGASDAQYSRSLYSLRRVPINGGTAQEVPTGGSFDEFRCPVSQQGTCVLRETIGHQQFVYYALDPVAGKGRELGRTAWTPTLLADWDIAPDASTIAIAIHDRTKPRIRLVTLAQRGQGAPEREISLTPQPAFLAGVSFAADGKGFYAGTSSDVGCDLLYVDLHGNATVLRHSVIGIWGVPSPDGTKLEFVDRSVDRNVWLRG